MRTVTRFLTDSSLDSLARRLRFLGYDVLTYRGARLEELFAAAAREGRTVLTLSARHPRRHAGVAAERVPRGDLATALLAIVRSHAPASERWSRCPVCNTALRSRSAFEAHGEVPGRVIRSAASFRWCPSCGQWYWPGSHVRRLEAWFDQVLGSENAGAGPNPHPPLGPGDQGPETRE